MRLVGDLVRVVLFVEDIERVTAFYRDILGLRVVNDEGGFVELDAGKCRVALHKAAAARPNRTKLTFRVRDVEATRAALVKKGARMAAVRSGPSFTACDGKDPEGNVFSISTRAQALLSPPNCQNFWATMLPDRERHRCGVVPLACAHAVVARGSDDRDADRLLQAGDGSLAGENSASVACRTRPLHTRLQADLRRRAALLHL